MPSSLVLTVIGPDRTGLVESLASVVAAHGGNWVESRMARLAGQFAGVLLVDVPREQREALTAALRGLTSADLQLVITPADTDDAAAPPAAALRFELLGHDRPGVVRDVSRVLAARGVNVLELETEVFSAPMSGEPLFRARIEAALPAHLSPEAVREEVDAVAQTLSMDVAYE